MRRTAPTAVLLCALAAPAGATPRAPVAALALPSLRATAPDLDPVVLARALDARACAAARGDLDGAAHPERLAIIDFALPSTARRLWVLDVQAGTLLFQLPVAHGSGTGDDLATTFGNDEGSHRSSLGLFRTAETYVGKHGRSLRLDGLEPGFNDRARERAIVIHGADYATEAFARTHGRLGRSWGCPAVAPDAADPLIDALEDGAALFAWYPDATWLTSSTYLHCDRP
ncbi:MAG: murein L,D-transpeptidase catalytic domain family protein [Alphaproteobacteria bacterium]|nr:murein L,D-transpeptidase catalytic domain family protein [Alphaproteobacteria bacterium]